MDWVDVDSDGRHYDYNLFKLTDKSESYHWYDVYAQLGESKSRNQYVKEIFNTEKECINYLTGTIIKKLRTEGYRGRKDNVTKLKVTKVWHK